MSPPDVTLTFWTDNLISMTPGLGTNACCDLDLWCHNPVSTSMNWNTCDQNWVKFLSLVFTRMWLMLRSGLCYHKSVWNDGAPYSGGWAFQQYFFTAVHFGYPLISVQNFTEIVPGEPLHQNHARLPSALAKLLIWIGRLQTREWFMLETG